MGDREMKHRKRDNASGVSSNESNIARAMQVRRPKVLANLAPPESTTENVPNLAPKITSSNTVINHVPQNINSRPLIAAPSTSTTPALRLPPISAPIDSLQQVLLKHRDHQKGHETAQNILVSIKMISLAN